ncbi:DUF4342 domain-containing protein [Deinococcus alpinitundrae]|uniref:DUF4342 domain-containing protein n=1 Tax=Deinococcus alpinitundrae TaxID=468913 RepID=UPI002356AF71|nr:DUF4342 domain-containing protein [Deinococcus alpinitundrae]
MNVQNKTTVSEAAAIPTDSTFVEELQMSGADLVGQLRELMKEGSARRVTVLNEHGDELMSISLTLGAVAGGLVALSVPALAAVGALAALATHVKVIVTRDGPAQEPVEGALPEQVAMTP